MPTQSAQTTPSGTIADLSGSLSANVGGTGASVSGHAQLTAVVGLALLAIVIFLPRVI